MERVLRDEPDDDDDTELADARAGADLGAAGYVVDDGADGRQRAKADLPAAAAADDTEGLMTSKIGSAATGKVLERITGPGGVNAALGAVTEGEAEVARLGEALQVRAQNVAAQMAEHAL